MRTLLGIVAVLVAAAPAPAATVTAREGACATARFTPPATGVVTTTLRAASGDWDLRVADARSGRVVARGASSVARERVIAAGTRGRALRASACRRRGAASSARVSFSFVRAPVVRRDFPARLVRVGLDGPGALERLEATGLDVTHNVTAHYADVVVYSPAEQAELLRAGFLGETLIADLRAETTRVVAQRAARPLPSGQAAYRTPAEYGEQLKGIASQYPAIARSVVAGQSLEGRPIEGVELAADVGATDDGRPTLLVLGLHHAREWPAGEMPMEFALDVARSHAAGDPRVRSLLERVRIVAIPVMNPDGFEVSRLAGPLPGDDSPFATLPLIATDSAAYKRKNCRPTAGSEAVPCVTRPTVQGVDLNRNYGAFWGGVGSDTDPTSQIYRGPAPYSEPESEAVHKLSSTRPVTLVISHHTFTDEGVWLRQPGFCKTEGACTGDDVVPDEAGMAALGAAMQQATGWRSALGWDIGEITGATEDWNYFTQGAYGYTPEQRGVNFHPDFEDAVVREYTGEDAGGSGGVREALLRAAETAADPASHAILSGTAPAGRTLRLTKAFDTPTMQEGVVVKDKLDFTLTVPASGRFTWHVNQSTRPLSAAPEAYTLTCEAADGTVQEQRAVTVARGETVNLDLGCGGGGPSVAPGAAAPVLSVRARSLSARKLNRTRRFVVRLSTSGGEVRSVRAWLVRGRRTIARGKLPRVGSATRTLRLRRVARARTGAYRLLVSASAGGRTVSVTKALKLER